MEEENIVKKENKKVNTNNNPNNKNGIIAILIVIIIALIGVVVYFAFIKKDDKPVDNNGVNNQQEPSNNEENNVGTAELNISKIEFTDEKLEQEVTLKNKIIKIKKVNQGSNSFLYINNAKVSIEEWEWTEIYSTGNLLLLGGSDICGTIINYAVNENAKLIKVTKNYSEANGDNGGEYYLNGDSIKIENGKIVAEIGHVGDCRCEAPDDYCEKNYQGTEKVEFVYNGDTVTIKK